MAPEAAILTHGLTKRYGERVAVDDLDLEVQPGEIFGLLGPNGAGKTTTILMLLGLSERSGGEAAVAGLDPARRPLEVKRQVGYLPDNVGFYAGLTGRENLRYTARLNGLREGERERRISELLERVGLTHAADDRVETYSRGMRQRLGIADALVKDPAIAILDEPTIGIDPEGVADMLGLIGGLARERGMTVLLSSHLLHQVQSICHRIGIFIAGRLVAQGTVSELGERLTSGRRTIEVAVEGDPGAVERVLASVPGVERVERDAGRPGLWLLTSTEDVRAAIGRALLEHDLPASQLSMRGEELDEIYRRYFREERDGRAR